MFKIILGSIGLILVLLTLFTSYIFAKDKEKNFPHFFSWNWPLILTFYVSILGTIYLIDYFF